MYCYVSSAGPGPSQCICRGLMQLDTDGVSVKRQAVECSFEPYSRASGYSQEQGLAGCQAQGYAFS